MNLKKAYQNLVGAMFQNAVRECDTEFFKSEWSEELADFLLFGKKIREIGKTLQPKTKNTQLIKTLSNDVQSWIKSESKEKKFLHNIKTYFQEIESFI